MYPSYSGDDYSFVLNEVKDKFMIVEGDWSDRLDLLTDDYFGKYRVDMSSHGKNLFDKNSINELQYMYLNNNNIIEFDPYESIYWVKIKPSTTYTISKMTYIEVELLLVKNYKFINGNQNGNRYREFSVISYKCYIIK